MRDFKPKSRTDFLEVMKQSYLEETDEATRRVLEGETDELPPWHIVALEIPGPFTPEKIKEFYDVIDCQNIIQVIERRACQMKRAKDDDAELAAWIEALELAYEYQPKTDFFFNRIEIEHAVNRATIILMRKKRYNEVVSIITEYHVSSFYIRLDTRNTIEKNTIAKRLVRASKLAKNS